jgi:hypothetical protein
VYIHRTFRAAFTSIFRAEFLFCPIEKRKLKVSKMKLKKFLKVIVVLLFTYFPPTYGHITNYIFSNADTITHADSLVIPNDVTADSVIEKYIESIGGSDSIKNVVDRTTVMRGTVQGQNVTIVSYQKSPNKLKQDIKFGTFNQQLLYDGQKGVMSTGENEIEILDEELEKLKAEATLDFILHPGDYGVKITLVGMKMVEAKNCYEVRFALPGGTNWTQFFDAESGYKVKEEKKVVTKQGSFDQQTFFYDYKPVNGVKYPFRIKQSFGAQQLEFNVSSIKINSGLKDELFTIK